MRNIWRLAVCLLVSTPTFGATESQPKGTEYDYIVVGSGPGGGPLAANLARAGHSVLLIEAGDDQKGNLHEEVASWGGNAMNDPLMRWDFFVRYHSNDTIQRKFEHLTWRLPDGQFWVGKDGEQPKDSTLLGVYYPRAATLGGCSTHNLLGSALPSDSDWNIIAELTGDKTWTAKNMRKYFIQIENNHYLPKGSPGHGFNGYLDLRFSNPEYLGNQVDSMKILSTAAKVMGQDPSKIWDHLTRDLNNNDEYRDQQVGLFGFPAHMDMMGRRVSARTPVDTVANAILANGKKMYKLDVSLNTFVTKILFDKGTKSGRPRAIGVDFLRGKSIYSADPRYNASITGTPGQVFARKEVIISGGAFNSPQILKLSGIGPKDELKKFGIPLLVDLPGVGANMQDNYEISVIGHAAKNFTNLSPQCTFGAGNDPCLELWREGKGPYVRGAPDALMYKSKNAALGERDIFFWGDGAGFRGFWPNAVNIASFGGNDGPNTFSFSMAKMHPYNRKGTVTLRSANPRDMPEINFRFFEDEQGDMDLEAMSEGIELGRRIFGAVGGELAPIDEAEPCNTATNQKCDTKERIRTQSWSHHATSTCSIGGEKDHMAVLDSNFQVRGVDRLRVVDGSAFPRVPGGFPVLPTFILSQKAADVILQAAKNLD